MKKMKKKTLLCLLLTAVLLLSAMPVAAFAASDTMEIELDVRYGQTEARSMLSMVNDFRTGSDAWYYNEANRKVYVRNLKPLSYDYDLEQVAMQRAAEIAIKFSHTRPNGQPFHSANFVSYSRCGENIAAGTGSYGRIGKIFDSWLETNESYSGQGHRRAMLSDKYTCVGIGHAEYNDAQFWVQEFSCPGSGAGYRAPNDSRCCVIVEVDGGSLREFQINSAPEPISLAAGSSVAAPGAEVSLRFGETFPDKSWSPNPTGRLIPDWHSDDSSVVSCQNGRISGVSSGKTTLRATAGGKKLTVPVEVKGSGGTVSGGTVSGGSEKPQNQPMSWHRDSKGWWYGSGSLCLKNCWQEIDGKLYHFSADGYMQTHWQKIDGDWFYFGSDGAMRTHWQQIDGSWYYFDQGVMLTGLSSIGGNRYYFASDGRMLTGWQKINGDWYYFASDGAMCTGWLQQGNCWYYLRDGVMQTSWQTIGGRTYYFSGDGVMKCSWQRIDGEWYYFNPSGDMVTGWKSIGGSWYYFDHGVMLTGAAILDGEYYYFDQNGRLT